jgi:hypothetical protein
MKAQSRCRCTAPPLLTPLCHMMVGGIRHPRPSTHFTRSLGVGLDGYGNSPPLRVRFPDQTDRSKSPYRAVPTELSWPRPITYKTNRLVSTIHKHVIHTHINSCRLGNVAVNIYRPKHIRVGKYAVGRKIGFERVNSQHFRS